MLNPNEAPEGYIATKSASFHTCEECVFYYVDCSDYPCDRLFRKDHTKVYFIKKETKMNKPHIHKDLIIAWANGAEIECYDEYSKKWEITLKYFDWLEDTKFRVKEIPLVPDSINWEHVHSDYKYMAREAHEEVFLFNEKPTINDHYNVWESDGEYIKADSFTSLKIGTVDWKDSLVTRP